MTAVDVSVSMLEILKEKAAGEGLDNIRTIVGNAETMEIEGSYTVACAFSSLEYLTDLQVFFYRLADHIEPGGTLYFITARRSLLRLFAQIGNALRQGLWLKAHSRREIEAILSASGFEEIRIGSHLFKSWLSGGILLESGGPPSRRLGHPGLRDTITPWERRFRSGHPAGGKLSADASVAGLSRLQVGAASP